MARTERNTDCPICGSEVVQPEGRGRTREYCSRECGLLESRLHETQNLLQLLRERMTAERVNHMRSRVWTLGNRLNK